MEQMTVKQLFNELKELIKQGMGDKKIVVATDTEGNNYRGLYYSCEGNPTSVEQAITDSDGLIESQTKNPKEIVIIG